MNHEPSTFVPLKAEDFIGPARTIALMLERKAIGAQSNPFPIKMLFFGSPGTGKTRLVEMFASRLAWHPIAIENTNGRNVTIDVVRRWQEQAHYIPMGGRWVIKMIQELDTTPSAAQDLLLHWLDAMPAYTAFLGTSNLQLMLLHERFETRLQQFKVPAPSTEEIASFLSERWAFSERQAMEIAIGSGGNVRAALLDGQSILDVQRIAA